MQGRIQEKVAEFHQKIGAQRGLDLKTPIEKADDEAFTNQALRSVARFLRSSALAAYDRWDSYGDTRMMRVHLMLEELGELIQAMADRDELEVMDGAADLLYVLAGTLDTYQLPLEAAFDEVHRSNMTKDAAKPVREHNGNTGKGKQFSPPDMQEVLRRWNKYLHVMRVPLAQECDCGCTEHDTIPNVKLNSIDDSCGGDPDAPDNATGLLHVCRNCRRAFIPS